MITSLEGKASGSSCQPDCEWAWVLRGGEDVWNPGQGADGDKGLDAGKAARAW